MEHSRKTTGEPAARDHKPARAEGLLNLNVLPERHRPRRLNWPTLAAWGLVVLLVSLLYPSYLQFEQAGRALDNQRADLAQVRLDLTAAQALPQQQERLNAEIILAEANLADLEQALHQLSIQTVSWGPVLEQAVALAPDGISLEQVRQSAGEVSLVGVSRSYPLPLAYAEALRTAQLFDGVSVQSIDRLGPEDEVAGQLAESAAGIETPGLAYRFSIHAFIEIAAPLAPDGPEVTE